MSVSARRVAAALAAALALAACATFKVGTDGLSFAERRARLEAVPAWQSGGRILVDTGERAFQARFTWVQDGERSMLDIRPRIGGSALRLEGTADDLVVTTRGDRYELTDPEAQLPALLDGWWVPVASLRSWLLGLPDADFRADRDLGAEGTVTRLAQRLWNVEYPAYQLVAAPQGETLVPRTIELMHGDLSLVVTVDEWAPLVSANVP